MQCSDPLISQESVQDWTALDYVAVPPKIQEVLTVSGSIFQELVNSRHLPLSIHLRTKFLAIRQDQAPPKRDFRLLASFYDKVESTLLAKTDNTFDFPSPSTRTLIAYTDGSCPNNRAVSYHNPAGWGFAVTFGYSEDERPPVPAEWTGLGDRSNQTLNPLKVSPWALTTQVNYVLL